MNTTVILIVAFFAIWSLIPIYRAYRKRQASYEHEYNLKYSRITYLIDNCEICRGNYVWILSLLHHLGQLPYRNKEKTEVLSMRFWRRFHEMAKQVVKKHLETINNN